MTDFFNKDITVYISVPENQIKQRTFERRVVERCSIQGQSVEKANGTMRVVVNAQTVITKNISNYVDPETFYNTPSDLRKDKFTINVGDFIVFEICDDVVENSQQFVELQQKYRNNGMKVTTENASIYGMKTDNLTVTNA
jgi:hypothetical protein